MVLCKLIGGLGNQMFSYAMGRALSLEKDTELMVDSEWVDEMSLDKDIDLLGLKYFVAWSDIKMRNGHDIFRKYDSRLLSRISSRVDWMIPYQYKSIIYEHEFNFEPRISASKSKNIYLKRGFWQSYKYFEKYEKEIRNDFIFQNSVVQECLTSASKILEYENSVSIHIRRGDYENRPEVAKVHGGICTLEYYTKSIDFLKKKLVNPEFFVFSDDLVWAKNALSGINHIHFIEHDIINEAEEIGHQDKGYQDMYLMSICKHNIIANSSFSWWGAWLNTNDKKIVVVPPKWFNDNRDTRDLIPETWIILT